MPATVTNHDNRGGLTAKQCDIIITRVQAFARYVHPRKPMDEIFEMYHLDWTERLSLDGVSFDQWIQLWEGLIDTESKRFADTIGAMEL